MNNKIEEIIRSAIKEMAGRGIKICHGGAWMEFEGNKIIAVDPIAAVIIVNNKMPILDSIDKLSMPGLLQLAVNFLEVDSFWLYKFWMGFDREFQIMFFVERKGKIIKETKDDVSEFGITLTKEIFG